MLPPTAETAAIFFGTWKLGALLLSMSVLYGDDGIRHRLQRLRRHGARHRPRERRRFDRTARACWSSTTACSTGARPSTSTADTAADDPAQLYYTSGTTGLAKGIVHAHRYVLAHEEFVYCHEVQEGERFHGMGEWAWAAGIAPLLGPWRLGAVQCVYQREGGFDPHKQLDFLSRHEVTNVFTTPTAMRSMMAIEDAGTRYPQRFRRVCSAGEPLNPEAIRWFREQYGITVLDYYGLTESYPLVANYPVDGRARGLDGPPDARLGRADPRRGRAARCRRASAARSACARARTRTSRSATGTTTEASEETFGGEWFHTKDAAIDGRGRLRLVRRPRRRRDHRRRLPDRARSRSSPRASSTRRSARPRRSRRPTSGAGNVVKAFIVLAEGHEPSDEMADAIKEFVRDRLSAYAYPRRIEFVETCRRR